MHMRLQRRHGQDIVEKLNGPSANADEEGTIVEAIVIIGDKDVDGAW